MDRDIFFMGQNEGFDINRNNNNITETVEGNESITMGMESNGTIFGMQSNMGNYSHALPQGREQSPSHIRTFFNQFGGYNIYNVISRNTKMATLILKLSFWISNMIGLGIVFCWITIDPNMVKTIITSLGAMCYMGMKLYEQFIELKDKIKKHRANRKRK
jgi:hypothetical protein